MLKELLNFSLPAKERQDNIVSTLKSYSDPESKYKFIIELGKQLPSLPEEQKIPANIVPGCQSIVYLHAVRGEDGKLYFSAYSEALISSGLAALSLAAYSGLSPQEILQMPPFFIEEAGLLSSLTPGRSNGLLSMITLIKQKALQSIIQKTT